MNLKDLRKYLTDGFAPETCVFHYKTQREIVAAIDATLAELKQAREDVEELRAILDDLDHRPDC